MSSKLNLAVNILFVLLILLALGWVWGVFANWDEINSRFVRRAYIICDFLFVIPVGFIAVFGLKRGKQWAGSLFALVLGALLFDIAHGIIYLIWDNYFGVPLPIAFILLLVVIGYVIFALRELDGAKHPS